MKPFRFPLQAVLTIRLNQENKALEMFARAQAELEKVLARSRRIEEEIEEVFRDRRTALRKVASSEDIQRMQQGLRALQETGRRVQVELQRAQAHRDEKSKVLLEAQQKREVVEKIEQKQRTVYSAHVARAEQKLLDDFATLKSIGNLALRWK